jgi:hypothetical protein
MDRPAADVLFCIFSQVPAWIEFDEPKEGLHFGVQEKDREKLVALRHVSGPDVGKLTQKSVEPGWDRHRKLEIQALLGKIGSELDLGDGGELGPAAFALQMVKTPEQMVFQTKNVE